jgi:hypothetical protein
VKFQVVMDPAALADLRALRAYERAAIMDVIQRVLTTAPTRASKSRIKRLCGDRLATIPLARGRVSGVL